MYIYIYAAKIAIISINYNLEEKILAKKIQIQTGQFQQLMPPTLPHTHTIGFPFVF